MWEGYKNYDHYYWVNPTDLVKWYNEAVESGISIVGQRTRYYNIPASFDIETSSFKSYGVKYATMYLWSFNLNGSTILGRTWYDWKKVLNFLNEHFNFKNVKLCVVFLTCKS